jgi:DNA-binding GntR family transcriptional regulator
MKRRPLVWVLIAAVILTALIPIGRWERSRRADEQNRGMRGVVSAVGSLDSPSLSAFRHNQSFDCLLYERGGNPFALELCVDHHSRLIEAIDRRGDEPRIWSLRDDPGRSTTSVDREQVVRLLDRMIGEPQ